MSADLTLYSNPMSRGRIARWMMEEIGQPYRVEMLDYGTAMKSAAYLAINPMGKVPCLVHGETVVTETAAICAYMADTFPDAGLAPTAAERGAYYRWLFFFAGPVEQAVTNKAMKFDVPADKKQMAGYGSYDETVETMERRLSETPYIAGDRFTAADVYIGAQIGWGLQFGTIPTRPVFGEYAARVMDRSAWRRATELDDAMMPTMTPDMGTPDMGEGT